MTDVIVIGGGAAGLIASGTAAEKGKSVLLLEKNDKLGKKMFISGKGRCNMTNACAQEEFMRGIVQSPKFFYSAFHRFNNSSLVELIESLGVKTKVERGGRVFPASDKSSDVIRALIRFIEKSGVKTRLNTEVLGIQKQGQCFNIRLTGGETLPAGGVIVCTGGLSYPQTGSTGDGYTIARAFGHRVTETRASLTGISCVETWPRQVAGLTLKNVTLTVKRGKKTVYKDLGELLFTHEGISGPLALTASALMEGGEELFIDLKPALDRETLDKRVLRDFEERHNKDFINAIGGLMPLSLTPILSELSGISGRQKVSTVTREQRAGFVDALKGVRLTFKSFGPIEEIEVPDLPEPTNASAALEAEVRRKEGERLLALLRPGDHLIALCIEGKPCTSQDLAARLSALQGRGEIKRTLWVIGGSLGLDEAVIARAHGRLSLSAMTFPHQLARVMLLEQLYRADAILRNRPYHHA